MIPHHLSNTIWEALTDVPNIQAGRTRLQEVFTQTPSYEDYLTAIKSHKKDTAPGMTGFSYRHLKTLPEDLHKVPKKVTKQKCYGRGGYAEDGVESS